MALKNHIMVFWVMTPPSDVMKHPFHPEDGATYPSERSVSYHITTCCNNPDDDEMSPKGSLFQN
jgi:hypothetical protein